MPSITPAIPSTHTAIVQHDGGVVKITPNLPVPLLEPGNMLVKTAAVALNPCDYKMPRRFPVPGTYDGCDFSGTVVALGSEVAEQQLFEIGDRVFAAVHGSNPIDQDSGSYCEYIKAVGVFTWKIPDWMSFEEAAGLSGTCIATVGMSLFWSLGLPGTFEQPVEKPVDVLVYGGSSSIGTVAIQMLKLMGHRAITTCSPKNFELVKSYGADFAFDYNSPTCAADIKALTRNSLRHILDPFAEATTMELCYACIGRAGGRYTALERYPEHLCNRKTVTRDLVMGATIIGLGVALEEGYGKSADPKQREWGIEWYKSVQKMIDARRLRAHPIRVIPGGFEGVLEGLEMLKKKAVSGQKLVVRIS